MDKNQFIESYLEDLSSLLKPTPEIIKKLLLISELFLKVRESGHKVLIFGNGGSAAIASHVSVDLTKNAKVRCMNFNEADLITCFANDFGFDSWVEKAIELYADESDVLIVISSSGESTNMLNGVKAARNFGLESVITLSGFSKNNSLCQLADINLWLASKAYNYVENVHQAWLLLIVDLIIGSREYSA